MSKPKTLTVAQLLVVSTAAQRPDHMILPLPATIRIRGGAQRNLLATLLKMDLVVEIPVDDAAIAWRTDEAGQQLGLRLTPAGLAAAGVSNEVPPQAAEGDTAADDVKKQDVSVAPASEPAAEEVSTVPPPTRRPTGKLGEVLQAISAEAGATLAEITRLTSWLPHTARAAVTGLRQRGFGIALIEQSGRKAYRLTGPG